MCFHLSPVIRNCKRIKNRHVNERCNRKMFSSKNDWLMFDVMIILKIHTYRDEMAGQTVKNTIYYLYWLRTKLKQADTSLQIMILKPASVVD
jgi:hypothetical protein